MKIIFATQPSKPPHAVFVPFMMGQHFGVLFHGELQRRIILEALDHLEKVQQSGEVRFLAATWARPRREGKAIEEMMRNDLRASTGGEDV
ncbi:MAG TPA: hypothetical protein VIQ24_11805 [Pyrinomonadaceae bacterium]